MKKENRCLRLPCFCICIRLYDWTFLFNYYGLQRNSKAASSSTCFESLYWYHHNSEMSHRIWKWSTQELPLSTTTKDSRPFTESDTELRLHGDDIWFAVSISVPFQMCTSCVLCATRAQCTVLYCSMRKEERRNGESIPKDLDPPSWYSFLLTLHFSPLLALEIYHFYRTGPCSGPGTWILDSSFVMFRLAPTT